MSPTDLNILADAVTFAMLVAIGGLIVFAAVRSTWKRHVLQHSAKVGLSVLVVVVVVAAGVALWPAAREGVNTAAGVDLDEQGRLIVTETEDFEPLTDAALDVADAYAGGRIISVLEGGYNTGALAGCVALHLERLLARQNAAS